MRGGGLEFSEHVGEIGVAPVATNHLTKTAPKKLGGKASEEDVIRVFRDATKRVKAGTGAIALADLYARRNPSADPLPHEDSDLQGKADMPNRREGRWGGGGGDSPVEELGGELSRRL